MLARLFGAGVEDQPWVRPAFLATTLLAAILYISGLTRNGYANSYYSAAALAAGKSWKALFFGSVDAGNFITVDKPAGALWVMDLSVRLFGLHSWSILLPEALAGVAAVALLFLVVRRSFGPIAGLLAALVLALTPVAVAMFRYNNPEAMLTLLLIAAAWALLRGIDTGRLRWVLLSAFFVGLGFNTKYLQAYLVLPALIVTFFLAARGNWWRRVLQLLAAAGVLLVSSGWWLVIVDLIPASARPYIGGSTNNSVLNLVLGYDGFGRIFGTRLFGTGQPGARVVGGFSGFGGGPSWLRLFNDQVGGAISWLLPFAAVSLLVGLWLHRRGPRTHRRLVGYTLWGSWLIVGAIVFSFSSGIFHEYYTIQLAPAIAALTGAGLVELWSWRARSWIPNLILGATLIGTSWWASRLLARTPTFVPWLRSVALAAAVLAAIMLVLSSLHVRRFSKKGLPDRCHTSLSPSDGIPESSPLTGIPESPSPLLGEGGDGGGGFSLKMLPSLAVALGFFAILAGPTSYSLYTVGHASQGALPIAGPISGRPIFVVDGGGFRGAQAPPPAVLEEYFQREGFSGSGAVPGLGQDGQGGAFAGRGPGAVVGSGATVDKTLAQYLVDHQGSATWIVAVNGAGTAASIELATGKPVMAMGGFLGSDPAPTLDQLKALVHSGKLRYVLTRGSGFFGGPGGSNSNAQDISNWVTQHGKQVTGVGNGNLYDLAGAA